MQISINYENRNSWLSWTAAFRNIFLFITVFGFIFFMFTIGDSPELILVTKEKYKSQKYKIQYEKYLVKTNACTIPAMQPLNKDVKKFVYRPKVLKSCPHSRYSLLNHNKTHIWVTEDYETLAKYKVSDPNSLECCYASFYRPDSIKDINSDTNDDRIKYNECRYFNDIIDVEQSDEYVRVGCTANDFEEVYNRFFIFAPEKKLILHDDAIPIAENKPAYNVLILGVDNISRLNFHRTMPKTAAFLKKRGGIELLGYNKVGDNSFPNIVPLLMGYDHREIKKICHPMQKTTYDDCPFLWHWYKEAGYYTAFGEDSAYLGTFNYFMSGFRKKPTDYYMRPFLVEAQNQARKLKIYNAWFCINEFYNYKIFLNYIENLTETLKSSRMFGFFWEVTVSHDDLNFPMFLDDDYLNFLKRLESSEYLNNTVLLFMSDHGIRWGPIRNTRQGYFEERLPLAYFLMPRSFKETYPKAFKNLKHNTRHLTTPFDLHVTLLDLIDVQNIVDDKISERCKETYSNNRGISLFLPIHGNRTCKAAGIDDHWCSCHQGVPISKESKEAVNAGKYLVQSLNALLINNPKCAKLSVSEVLNAEELKAEIAEDVEINWREFTVTVKVNPSNGIFEGTVRSPDWKVVGTVSRVNLYGNQSICEHDPQLKLYCYCKSNISVLKDPEFNKMLNSV